MIEEAMVLDRQNCLPDNLRKIREDHRVAPGSTGLERLGEKQRFQPQFAPLFVRLRSMQPQDTTALPLELEADQLRPIRARAELMCLPIDPEALETPEELTRSGRARVRARVPQLLETLGKPDLADTVSDPQRKGGRENTNLVAAQLLGKGTGSGRDPGTKKNQRQQNPP
jgi:hypothetical protein